MGFRRASRNLASRGFKRARAIREKNRNLDELMGQASREIDWLLLKDRKGLKTAEYPVLVREQMEVKQIIRQMLREKVEKEKGKNAKKSEAIIRTIKAMKKRYPWLFQKPKRKRKA